MDVQPEVGNANWNSTLLLLKTFQKASYYDDQTKLLS